jgi:hypothetical protein
VAPGTCEVTVEQGGDADYEAAAPVQRSFQVEKTSQTLDFPTIANKTFGDADFDPGASASSGLPVTYSSQTGAVCTIVSAKVHLVAAGTCEVTAEQGGDADYEAAAPVQRSFQVTKAAQTITFTAPTDRAFGSADFDPGATSSPSGLPVTYASQAVAVCTIVSGKIHLIAAGECKVTAEQGGDADWEAAAPVQRSFQVSAPAASAPPSIAPEPKIAIRHSPESAHNPDHTSGSSRYTFVFADAASDVTFYCSLDKAPFKACHSPKVYRHLRQGHHVFRLKSVDAAGNAAPVKVVHFFAGRRRHPAG